jgi:dihydrolipoamide dehydrogenase
MYDLIVLGGGPGGYLAAERAGHAGLKVLLIEKRKLGGVCLNEGCVPSKTLLNSAKIFDYANHGESYGVSTTGATIDQKAVIARKNKVVDTLVSGITSLMKANKVTVVYGEGVILDKTHIKVDEEVYEGKNIIIATGSMPVIPPIDGVKEGVETGFIMTNREILDLEEIPKELVIIGGGVIGLEMASYFNSVGSKVTVIEMLSKIAGATDDEISTILMKNYASKGVEFKLNTKVIGVKDGKVLFEGGEVNADKVLLSMGRRPVIQGIGIENIGVAIDRGAIITDKHMLTNIPNVYAVGDVNAKYMLAHTAYREAEVAVNNILGKKDIMRYDAIPSVIYTNPEVACIGETEETAKQKGIDFEVANVSMMYSGRYVAENSTLDGICKIIIDKKYRKIIGAHLIGTYASEMIVSVAMMIETEMQIDDIKEIVFPHPTVCEIIREAIFKF